MLKKTVLTVSIIFLSLYLFLEFYIPALPENHGQLQTQLFLGDGTNQSLVVGFGGGEGGNAWASGHWKKKRDEFLENGYAFLAIGYFGSKNTPSSLDRISLNAIHDTIAKVALHPKINREKIALIGGSKGGELVLNLASRFDDIGAVVAIVPSHVSFPALTIMANTSSWSFNDKEIEFVRAPYRTILPALKGDLYGAHAMMLEDKENVGRAAIEVERINGPVLLMSAKGDEQWPSAYMSEEITKRLEEKKFKHHFQHLSYQGGHAEPLEHFDDVFEFLKEHFKT